MRKALGSGLRLLSGARDARLFARHSVASSAAQRAVSGVGGGVGGGGMSGSVGQRAGLTRWTESVTKAGGDERAYRVVELENGLRALLVSDGQTDKSAAALAVGVGHLSDPRDLPGLAHFCEHMLFLGTKAFPEENAYHKFLSENGGAANAYTAADQTLYFFDVRPAELGGALDRFAAFFLSPLFNEDCVDREVNAVASEDQNYQKNDSWRLIQLERSFSRPEHDYSKFGTGNRLTLWDKPQAAGQNPRDELLRFHQKHYSASAMSLCIIGKESLDQLEEMAVSHFKAVPTNGRPRYEWTDHPWGPEQVGHRLDIVPIKDLRSLHLSFPVPDQQKHFRTQPGGYLSHLLGHEGPGSLLSELKRRGWVSSLSAGLRDGASGFAFFSLDVDLSEDGLEHVDDILRLTFAYLALLKDQPLQKWIFDEVAKLSNIRFQFKDKENPQSLAMGKAASLHKYKDEDVLVGPYAVDEWKPELVQALLDKLQPRNFTALVMASKFADAGDLKKEQWYGTQYRDTLFPAAFLDELAAVKPDPAFHLPKPNAFIPEDFSVAGKTVAESALEEFGPRVVEDTKRSRLWHKLDREYLLPKTVSFWHFSSPLAYAGPLEQCLTRMLVMVAADELTELTYDAELAGLNYHLENGRYGFSLEVSGYSHKLPVLLKTLVSRFTTLKMDPQRFEVLKESYIRKLRSWPKEQPYTQAMTLNNELLAQRAHSKEDQLEAATEGVTLEALKDFLPRLLASLHVEGLCHGSLSEASAKEYLRSIWEGLEGGGRTVRAAYHGSLVRDREVALPDGASFLRQRPNPTHSNSALELLLQTGTQETKENMLLELVGQLLSEPAFDQLRTKESLGYIVFSGVRRSQGSQGLRLLVQGEKDPAYVEARVEQFLKAQLERLRGLSEEELGTAVEALASQRLEKPKKLRGRASRFWGEILSQTYDFQRDVVEVAALREVGKAELVGFFEERLALGGPRRRKLATAVVSAAVAEARAKGDGAAELATARQGLDLPDATPIDCVASWKRARGLSALPLPAKDLPPLGLPSHHQDPPSTPT